MEEDFLIKKQKIKIKEKSERDRKRERERESDICNIICCFDLKRLLFLLVFYSTSLLALWICVWIYWMFCWKTNKFKLIKKKKSKKKSIPSSNQKKWNKMNWIEIFSSLLIEFNWILIQIKYVLFFCCCFFLTSDFYLLIYLH